MAQIPGGIEEGGGILGGGAGPGRDGTVWKGRTCRERDAEQRYDSEGARGKSEKEGKGNVYNTSHVFTTTTSEISTDNNTPHTFTKNTVHLIYPRTPHMLRLQHLICQTDNTPYVFTNNTSDMSTNHTSHMFTNNTSDISTENTPYVIATSDIYTVHTC